MRRIATAAIFVKLGLRDLNLGQNRISVVPSVTPYYRLKNSKLTLYAGAGQSCTRCKRYAGSNYCHESGPWQVYHFNPWQLYHLSPLQFYHLSPWQLYSFSPWQIYHLSHW